MRDELTDEQRARLCILECVIEIALADQDVFDVLRLAHWVEHGRDPEPARQPEAAPDGVAAPVPRPWTPAL